MIDKGTNECHISDVAIPNDTNNVMEKITNYSELKLHVSGWFQDGL